MMATVQQEIVIQELHRVTAQLATSGSKLRIEEEKVKKDGEEDFDSLLWGPKEPPLLSQFFKST